MEINHSDENYEEILKTKKYIIEASRNKNNITFHTHFRKESENVSTFISILEILEENEEKIDFNHVFEMIKEKKSIKVNLSKKILSLEIQQNDMKSLVFELKMFKKETKERDEEFNVFNLNKWISKNNIDLPKIKFKDNKITAVSNSHIFSEIVLCGEFKFSLKIINVNLKLIVGIADIRNTNKGYLDDNYIGLANIGQLCQSHKVVKKVNRIVKGDIVTFSGNVDEKVLKIHINDAFIIEHNFSKSFSQKNIQWVPYIYLFSGSSVEILESFIDIKSIPTFLVESIFDWDKDILYEIHQLVSFMPN